MSVTTLDWRSMSIGQNPPGRTRVMRSVPSAITNGLLRGSRPVPPPDPAEPEQASPGQALPPLALLPVLAIAVAVTAVLATIAGQYGYVRDELYYLAAGQHLAWGYPDMPPLTSALARLLSGLAPGSLVALRLPCALSGGVMIVLTAMITRELRGGRAAQLLACAVMAVAPLIATFHYFGTEDFDLLVSVLLCWLFIRILRTGASALPPLS